MQISFCLLFRYENVNISVVLAGASHAMQQLQSWMRLAFLVLQGSSLFQANEAAGLQNLKPEHTILTILSLE